MSYTDLNITHKLCNLFYASDMPGSEFSTVSYFGRLANITTHKLDLTSHHCFLTFKARCPTLGHCF